MHKSRCDWITQKWFCSRRVKQQALQHYWRKAWPMLQKILNYHQHLTALFLKWEPLQLKLQRHLYEIVWEVIKLDCTLLYTILCNKFTAMIEIRMQDISINKVNSTYILQWSDLLLFSHFDDTLLSLSTDMALLALINPHKLQGIKNIVTAIWSLLTDEIFITVKEHLLWRNVCAVYVWASLTH